MIDRQQIFTAALFALLTLNILAAPPDLTPYEINPKFRLEPFAAEPVVVNPADMAWDEQGRIYVVEITGYPLAPASQRPFPGKIVRIEDTDGDGICDKRTVFAEDLQYACSILPWRGGLLVANPPYLNFMKDNDGDGIAEQRDNLLTGFLAGNSQHNYNGLMWGLDNWVYGSSGGNGGKVRQPGQSAGEAVSLSSHDFKFQPESGRFALSAESSGGFGYALDDWGHSFTTHNTLHIIHQVFPSRYIDRNGRLGGWFALNEIAGYREGSMARIYPIGAPETRVNHPEQSGYFSGSCGITHYGGGAFGSEFNDNFFVADVVCSIGHRMIVKPNGASFMALRGEGEEHKEFLASADHTFRPVNYKTGPDGALYIMALMRDVIEHPEWIPDDIEKTMNVRSGDDKGRIYRIVPKGGLPRVTPSFDQANLGEVVGHLGNANKWWRDTAQRLLVEWKDPGSLPMLRQVLEESDNPLARLHSMYTLSGLNRLEDDMILRALKDPVPGMRENAVILAEPRLKDSKKLRSQVLAMAEDPDLRVKMQAALTIGELIDDERDGEEAQAAYLKIARSDADEEWIRKAMLTGLGRAPLPLFTALSRDLASSGPDDAEELVDGKIKLLQALAETIGRNKNQEEVGTALDALLPQAKDRSELVAEILKGLVEGLNDGERQPWMSQPNERTEAALRSLLDQSDSALLHRSWATANLLGVKPGEKQREMLARSMKVVADPGAEPRDRLNALALLEFEDFPAREELLFSLLDIKNPTEIQTAAMEQLKEGPNDTVAPRLIEIWKTLGPDVRGEARNLLLYRERNHDRLLTAFENQDILIGQMNFNLESRRALLFSKVKRIRDRANALFKDSGVITRAEALNKMKPAESLAGDGAKGHEVWKNLCAKCHIIGEEGSEVGPNLTDIFRKSRETLLHDILDPNAAVETRHISYTIVTKNGDIHSGLLHAETPAAVTLREGDAKDTEIPRAEIKEMYSSGLSMMPEELEKDMEPQTMADLLAFLQQTR